jgi:hypothetical protein
MTDKFFQYVICPILAVIFIAVVCMVVFPINIYCWIKEKIFGVKDA